MTIKCPCGRKCTKVQCGVDDRHAYQRYSAYHISILSNVTNMLIKQVMSLCLKISSELYVYKNLPCSLHLMPSVT